MPDARPFGLTEAVNEARRCLQCVEAFCTEACPARVDARGFIQALATGNLTGAIRRLKDHNVLPLTCALVCPVERLCEGACRWSRLTYPILISRLQRFVAEQDLEKGLYHPPRQPATGRAVAVVGSGPAGLAAASQLALLGHEVTVFERRPVAGGLLTGGIPPYRLAPDIARREVDAVARLGVRFQLQTPVHDLDTLLKDGFQAVVLATGLGAPVRLGLPGEQGPHVYGAIEFLEQIARTGRYDRPVGRRVLVIGGGSVAMDCAGCARRGGAEVVEILCLEGPNEMPASRHEIFWGWDEGAIFHFRAKPHRILRDGDRVTGLEAVRIRWKQPGLFVPSNAEEIPDTRFVVPADTIIVAIGQRPHPDAEKLLAGLTLQRGRLVVDPQTRMTSRPGIFAAGDICLGGGMTVVKSVAEGQAAAREADRYVRSLAPSAV